MQVNVGTPGAVHSIALPFATRRRSRSFHIVVDISIGAWGFPTILIAFKWLSFVQIEPEPQGYGGPERKERITETFRLKGPSRFWMAG